jgi:hypothetical protein
MGQAWAALLGALVGGLLTLAGAFAVELRRDRRRQIGAARLVVAEFRRAEIEFDVRAETAESKWFEGPHAVISSAAWLAHASEFVGALNERDFKTVDHVAEELRQAGEYGFTLRTAKRMGAEVQEATKILMNVAVPTWFDRGVWRL